MRESVINMTESISLCNRGYFKDLDLSFVGLLESFSWPLSGREVQMIETESVGVCYTQMIPRFSVHLF